MKQIRKFVFINHSHIDTRGLQLFHGKAIALDINHRHAPFPPLFIIHEMRVRGFYPFEPVAPSIPDGIPWQDWIVSDGVYDDDSKSFNTEPRANNDDGRPAPQIPQLQPMRADGTSSGRNLALNSDVIADILAATYAMPS